MASSGSATQFAKLAHHYNSKVYYIHALHKWTACCVLILQDVETLGQLDNESAITHICHMTEHE